MGSKKKNPFDSIELSGEDAVWFEQYLKGNNRNEEIERRRRETLRRAGEISFGEVVNITV
ncbi:hypothetical protein GF354_01940 [Candidatus Peregrinibacteria bacterium]|nr:hypothetical protein [Candidatus Peregrinibacteria bacterium]